VLVLDIVLVLVDLAELVDQDVVLTERFSSNLRTRLRLLRFLLLAIVQLYRCADCTFCVIPHRHLSPLSINQSIQTFAFVYFDF